MYINPGFVLKINLNNKVDWDQLTNAALDPEKLKHFSHVMNEDGELLLYRRSSIGLTNLIIHEENVIALSLIPFDANRQSSVEFSEDPSEITTWA